MEVDEHTAVADRSDAARNPHALTGFGTCGQPGIVSLEIGRVVAAYKAVRIRIDPPRSQAFELADPGSP